MKLETDLFDLAKVKIVNKCVFNFEQNKTSALSLDLSHNGEYFSVMGKDKVVRVYRFLTGKIIARYDESAKVILKIKKT